MINFLKTSIKGILENVDVWISPLKTEEKSSPNKYLLFCPVFFSLLSSSYVDYGFYKVFH